MAGTLENACRTLIARAEYAKCEKKIRKAMEEDPHSAVPHNLMGILLEQQCQHTLAMKHFRAAAALDPTYIPARYNMEQFGTQPFGVRCAFCEDNCPAENDPQFAEKFDENHQRHLVHL